MAHLTLIQKDSMTKYSCSHTDGPYHDCTYVNRRNELVLVAEMECDQEEKRIKKANGSYNYDREFFAKMNELAVKDGLIKA